MDQKIIEFSETSHPGISNILEPSLVDRSLVEYEQTEYYTMNTTGGGDTKDFQLPRYEIQVNNTTDWLDMSNAWIQCHFRLTQADGTPIPDNHQAVFSGNSLNLWKKSEYWMNRVNIQTQDYPGICDHVQGLSKYSKNYELYGEGSQYLYCIDRGNGLFSENPYDIDVENVDYNKAISEKYKKSRYTYSSANKSAYEKDYVCMVPLSKLFSYFQYNKQFLKGIQHKIILYRNDINAMVFRTTGGADVNKILKINYLSLWVPHIKMSKKFDMMIDSHMSEKTKKIVGFNKIQYYEADQLLNYNQNSFRYTLPASEVRPKIVYFFIQDANARDNQLKNNFIMPMQPISKIQLSFNGKVLPKQAFESKEIGQGVDPSDKILEYTRFYQEFLKVGGKYNTGKKPIISYEEFVRLYGIVVFDMSQIDEKEYYADSSKARIDFIVNFSRNLISGYNITDHLEDYNKAPSTVNDQTFRAYILVESESKFVLNYEHNGMVPESI